MKNILTFKSWMQKNVKTIVSLLWGLVVILVFIWSKLTPNSDPFFLIFVGFWFLVFGGIQYVFERRKGKAKVPPDTAFFIGLGVIFIAIGIAMIIQAH